MGRKVGHPVSKLKISSKVARYSKIATGTNPRQVKHTKEREGMYKHRKSQVWAAAVWRMASLITRPRK